MTDTVSDPAAATDAKLLAGAQAVAANALKMMAEAAAEQQAKSAAEIQKKLEAEEKAESDRRYKAAAAARAAAAAARKEWAAKAASRGVIGIRDDLIRLNRDVCADLVGGRARGGSCDVSEEDDIGRRELVMPDGVYRIEGSGYNLTVADCRLVSVTASLPPLFGGPDVKIFSGNA